MKDKKIKAIIERFLRLSKPKISKPDPQEIPKPDVDSYFRKMLNLDCPPHEMDKIVLLGGDERSDLSNMDNLQMKEQCRLIASNINKMTLDMSIETLCEVINKLIDRVSKLESLIIINEATK